MGIKKTLCVFAAAVSAAALSAADAPSYPLSVTAAAEEAAPQDTELRDGDYSYIINGDGATVTLTKYNGSDTKADIPQTLGGKPVTVIGMMSFSEHGTLESVTIPEGVNVIGESAFLHCSSLSSVMIPDSVTEIDTSAFYGSSLVNIDIPRGVTKISERAFNGCTALKAINVDESNANFSSVDGVLFNKGKTVILRYPIGKENTTYKIPEGVTELGVNVFRHCETLKSVIIPDSVTEIGISAFENCTSLTSAAIPDSVTEIGEAAFSVCTSLENISVPVGVTEINNSVFFGCETLKTVTIPINVTRIGNWGFFGCTSLVNITIPNSVKEIGFCVFDGCTALENVYYGGTREQWNAIDINDDNTTLKSLQVEFSSDSGRPAVPSPGASSDSSTSRFPSGYNRNGTGDTAETEIGVSDADVKSAVDAVNNGAASRDIKISDSVTLTVDKDTVKSIDPSRAVVINEITAASPDKNIRGTAAKAFTVSNAGNAEVSVKLDGDGGFANVYKVKADGKSELVGVAKISGGKADFALDGNGDYVIMTSGFSDLPGDADNDGRIGAKDAAELLKEIAKLKNAANNAESILDFNKDGKVNAKDAAALLKYIAGVN